MSSCVCNVGDICARSFLKQYSRGSLLTTPIGSAATCPSHLIEPTSAGCFDGQGSGVSALSLPSWRTSDKGYVKLFKCTGKRTWSRFHFVWCVSALFSHLSMQSMAASHWSATSHCVFGCLSFRCQHSTKTRFTKVLPRLHKGEQKQMCLTVIRNKVRKTIDICVCIECTKLVKVLLKCFFFLKNVLTWFSGFAMVA